MFGLIRVKSHKHLLAEAKIVYDQRIENLTRSQEREVNTILRYFKSRLNFCSSCGKKFN